METKSVRDLTIVELEKLTSIRMNQQSNAINRSISEFFQRNYRSEYKIDLRFKSNTEKSISVSTKIYDPILGQKLDLSSVGAGIRSIYILSLLQSYQKMGSNRAIFLIEEPELYLHPELQKKMASILSLIAEESQVFITTHSPIMLNEFSTEEIRRVMLDEITYESKILTSTISDILDDIGYSTQDIIQTDFILFVEGETDKRVLELLIEKYYFIDTDRILIIDTKSCSNIAFYASLRFLEKTTIGDRYMIIRDSDTSERNEVISSLMNKLEENSIHYNGESFQRRILITEYTSIEGYLFSPTLLVEEGLFQNEDEVFQLLKDKLSESKEKHIDYFKKHNNKDSTRIAAFNCQYDDKVSDIKQNIEWMKKNIRGHDYFGFTRSAQIDTKKYIDKLPVSSFQEILDFFDSSDFFSGKRR